MSRTNGFSRFVPLAARRLATPLLAALLLACLAAPAAAQTDMATVTAKILVGHDPGTICFNQFYWPEPVPCICGPAGGGGGGGFRTAYGPVQNPEGIDAFRDFQSTSGSFVPFSTFNYHHPVLDYFPGSPAGGCGSCGGGSAAAGSSLMNLFIQRIHRYRDMTTPCSSFGPGVFCNYDVSLLFEPGDGYMGAGAGTYTAEIFEPRDLNPIFLIGQTTGQMGQGSPTGIYLDTKSNRLNNLKCYDHNGAFVIDPNSAATAVMTNWPGDQYAFEMINMGGYAANPTALYHFNEGSGTSASDSSGNGNTGTLVNSPSWVAGETGDALSFNGTSNYVSLGNPADLGIQGSITLAAWVKVQNSNQTSAAVISHGSFNPMGMNTSPSVFLQLGMMGMQVGCVDSNNTTHSAVSMLQSGDAGTWVHWAGTYDGTNWTLYRNGQIPTGGQNNPTASTVGAVAVNANWSIGANGAGTQSFFNGAIDEVHIFNRALSPVEIAVLASPTYLAGRLKTITDRNGYQVTVTRPTFTTQQINQSPELQWQINTVSDPYGRVATFHYQAAEISGRWAVSEIDFPNGHKAEYAYANGQLSTVTFDDGTQSTLSYGADATSQTSTVQFHDVAAEGTHRDKTVYLTNNILAVDGDSFDTQVMNQSSLSIRMATNGAGELSYLSLFSPYGGGGSFVDYVIYEGAGRAKLSHLHHSQQFYLDGWTVGDPTQGYSALTGTLESTSYASLAVDATTQGLGSYNDPQGHNFTFTNDTNGYPTQKTYSDNTIETWTYDPTFKQVTRHQDRNNNVTLNTYDVRGNLLSREVGIKFTGGSDVHQPEYGKYQWTFFPTGDPNQYLMSAAIDANGNETDFVYDNNHKLLQVIEPADVAGGQRATTTFAYDGSSRIQSITDPVNRQVQYGYDERDRNVSITYGDTSTEKFYFGAQGTIAPGYVKYP